MKKAIFFSLIFFYAVTLSAKTNHYNLFTKALKQKNYKKALRHIATAYKSNSNKNYIAYWYGISLYRDKQYNKAIRIFSRIKNSYNQLMTHWYIARCYEKTAQILKAIKTLQDALNFPDSKNKWHRYIYGDLIKLLIKSKKTASLISLEKKIWAYHKQFPSSKAHWTKYKAAAYYLNQALYIAKLGNFKASFTLFRRSNKLALEGIGKYKKYYNPSAFGRYFKKKKMNKFAIKVFKILCRDFPSSKHSWYLSEVYKSSKMYDKAIDESLRGIKLNEKKKYWKKFLYYQIITLLKKTANFKKLIEIESGVLLFFKSHYKKKLNYIRYITGIGYLNHSIKLVKKNKLILSKTYYNAAYRLFSAGAGKYKKNFHLNSYPYHLYKIKKYNHAIAAYKRLPISKRSLRTSWYLALSHKKINEYSKAAEVLKKALGVYKKNTNFKKHVYYLIVPVLIKLQDTKTLSSLENEIYRYFNKKSDKYFNWIKYKLAKYYYGQAITLMQKDKISETLRMFDKSLSTINKGLGKYSKYIKNQRINFLKKVAGYWGNNKHKLGKAYKHNFFVAVFKNIAARWTDKDGGKHYTSYSMDENKTKEYPRAFDFFRKVFFYYSGGRLNFTFKLNVYTNVIKNIKYSKWESNFKDKNGKSINEVDIYSPVLQTMIPHPGSIFFENRNKADSFIIVFPSKGITGVCTGGVSRPMYIPYMLNGNKIRGWITLASTSMNKNSGGLLCHEFFHNVEGTYRKDYKFIAHRYKETYKEHWPAWYKGDGELSYYEEAFKRIILPAGIKKLFYKTYMDTTSDTLFNKYQNSLLKVRVSEFKKIHDYKKKASKLIKTKKYDSALKYLKTANKIFSEDAFVNGRIAHVYYKKKDYENSLKYFLKASKLKPKERHYMSMIAYLYSKVKKYNKAASVYRNLYKFFGRASHLYSYGSMLNKLNKHVLSVNVYTSFLKKFPRHKYSQYILKASIYMIFNKLKQYRKTIAFVKKYMKLSSTTATSGNLAFYRGRAHGELDESDKAVYWLKKSLELGYKSKGNVSYYIKKYAH